VHFTARGHAVAAAATVRALATRIPREDTATGSS